MIETSTTTGASVELIPRKYRVYFHLKTPDGVIEGSFRPDNWGVYQVGGRKAEGVKGRLLKAKKGMTHVVMTIPRADFDAAIGEMDRIAGRDVEAAKKFAEKIESGEELIRLTYIDGEYLSGWTPIAGHAADLLKRIGLARSVSGWGVMVDTDAVEALGSEFGYPDAVEFARPALEAKAAKKAANEAEIAAKFDEARTTGEKVEVDHWTEECDGSEYDCDMDIIIVYAMPDGTQKVVRSHTY